MAGHWESRACSTGQTRDGVLVRSDVSEHGGLRLSPSVLHGIGLLHRHSRGACAGGQEIPGTSGGSEH